jgi:flagellar biosynthesis protein FlhG
MTVPANRPLTIAISSGKGGVGKSQLAASLAAVLGRDRRVLLVDGDVGVGDLAILTGTSPGTDLRAVLRGAVRVEDAITAVSRCEGGCVDLLPAPSPGPRGGDLKPAEQLAMVEAVGWVGGSYDVVIVDTGAGVTANPMLLAAASDRILLITTPEPTAIYDAYAAIKVLYQAHRVGVLELVVNGVTSRNDGKRTYRRLLSVVQAHLPVALVYVGALEEDDRVRRSVHQRTPATVAYPHSSYSRSVRRLADRLFRIAPPVRPAGGIRFFRDGPQALGAAS